MPCRAVTLTLLLFSAIPAVAQFEPNRYTVLLEDPPVSARFPRREQMQTPAARAYRTQIEARQTQVRTALEGLNNVRVTGSVSTVLNAIFVIAPPSRLSQILAIPGVAAVRPQRRYQALLNRATQLMNAPAAWSALGGEANAGIGMKIAIIDTGIDNTHPAFQDSLPMPSGFPICSGFSGNCSDYTNHKIIVARSYVKQLAGYSAKQGAPVDDTSVQPDPTTSQPDDYTPRDHAGHGTATAAAAAADSNTGPALASGGGNITFTGMAPKAYLGNYKIFGSPGVNDSPTDSAMILAIDDALNDGMDVASLSVGGSALTGALDTGAACGLPAGQPCDPVAYAYENAAKAGLVVVVAAGNSGSDAALLYGQHYPYYNSISSPATAPSAIGVGATTNSHVLTPTVTVNTASAPANVKGLTAETGDSTFFPSSQGANIAPLIDVSQLNNDGYACSPLPAYSLTGAFALIERGPINNPCTFAQKAQNAQAAGAIGIIFWMADASPLFSPSGLGPTGANFSGPTVIISNVDGIALKIYIDANPAQPTTIDSAGAETDLTKYDGLLGISIQQNQLASYTSFGPTPDGAIKPDLVATGGGDVDIALSSGMYLPAENIDPNGLLYSQNRYAAADGTSFSTPLVAGAAALIKQAHPNYTVAEIKSVLVNAAAQDTTTDDGHVDANFVLQPPGNVDVRGVGAGRLDAAAALNSTLSIAPATVSLGYVKSGSLPISKTLTVTNLGTATANVALAIASANAASGATVAVAPTSLTLASGASNTVTVTLSGSVPAPGSYSGALTLSMGNTVTQRVPYLFLVSNSIPFNVVPLSFGSIQGTPGGDGGTIALQALDQFGVPVSGVPVAFTVDTPGAVTFRSVPGEQACSSTGQTATCPTDSYGIAYTEVFLGSNPGSPTITATPNNDTSLSSQFTAFILSQPAITSGQILDNAAFQPVIAPGSIVAIKGGNLMDPSALVNTTQGYDVATTPVFPLMLDSVSVSFDVPGTGISVPAPVVAVSSGQVNIQVPWELQGQTTAQVKVILDEQFGVPVYSAPVTATIAPATPAFFTNAGAGCGQGTNGPFADALDANYHVITCANPAASGDTIMLYVNGLGAVNNQPPDGAPAVDDTSTTKSQPTVTIGGQTATVKFSGIAPTLAVYQVNAVVPAGLSSGNQPITISIGGQTSPANILLPVK
jgi:minor extracellular serine protease Vpr